jgi:hypothetical protein
MAVVIVKDVPRCKLCVASKAFGRPDESELNRLLEKRRMRQKDENGNVINFDYVARRFEELGFGRLTMENAKLHNKHIEFVHESKVEQERRDWAEAEKNVRSELAETSGADVADKIIDLELKVYLAKRQIQAERGEIDAVTADQVRALIGEKTKRKHNDAQDELLKGLAGAVGGFIGKAIGTAAVPVLEAAEPEVVDAEVVSVD